ncbi:hypothetical protein D3OALGA1CA_220 [Olavius algarvensis associated proteobacterium Delta 3]|nr:hypothetical protein D3OALGA1CA_220 [Olavius algarvensis associated proteobacterium Delta 3]CAB5102172.1 hypothetical protein D3OALGB2SA_1903 [Olavius algarvensis associated proteobacterium Delta 3]
MDALIRMIWKHIGYCCFLLSVLCFLPSICSAEFYRYTDKDGRMVFVDDISKIPPEHLDQIRTYKEQYDNLPEETKAILMDRDRNVEASQRDRIRGEENALREQKQQEKNLTNIVIEGNKILVPVTLGHDGVETEAMLVLDTGATIIALHREIADQLEIKDAKKARFRVVGGNTIETDVVQLSYVKVGPHLKEKLHAGIIDHQGVAVSYNGLLGMNFLRGLAYSIDFDNQVIKWHQ